MWDNAILFSLCEKNLPIKIVVRKFSAVEVERNVKVGESKPVNDELCDFHKLYKDKLF